MFFFGHLRVGINASLNERLDKRQDRVVFVFHDSLRETNDGRVQHLSLDISLVGARQLSVDFLAGIFNYALEDLGLVHGFVGLSLFKNADSSFVDVLLEGDLFVGQEGGDGFSLDVKEFSVELPEFELVSSDSDHVLHLVFDVFLIENFKVVNFVGRDSSVPSDEEGLEQGLSKFKIEVLEEHPEHEGDESGLGNPVEVNGGDTKTQGEQSSEEGHQVFSGDQEVLVVRRDLLRADKIVEELGEFYGGEVQGVVVRVERMTISLGEGLLDA